MRESAVINFKLESFEGPLDLLLSLIAKNKINIYNIRIVELVDQYTQSIEAMKNEDMDIACEFLDMASRLIYIKSVSLLPKYEQEAETLKKELTGQLVEYLECKETAARLAQLYSNDRFVREPSAIEYDLTYNRIHPCTDVCAALEAAIGRGKSKLPPPQEAFGSLVAKKIITVGSKIIGVMRRLRRTVSVKYRDLFSDSRSKSELVATFLAVLELVKDKRVSIDGGGDNAEVVLINKASDRNRAALENTEEI